MKGNATMRHYLKSLVAVFALILATGPIAGAADFMYITNGGQGPSFVSKFDELGTYYGRITTNLNGPAGIAQDSSGNIFIVNNGNNTVSLFDKDMNFTSTINNTYLGGGAQVAAIDKYNNLYVSLLNGNIVKYDSSENYVMTISGAGRNSNAQGMVLDAQDNLYVASYGTNSVEIFDSASGAWKSRITGNGLSGPHGVARDGNGYLYVTNATANTISKFNPDGTANTVFNGGGVLSFPIGIGFDSAGDFFVANNGNNTSTKYDANGNLLLTIPNTNLAGARWLAFQPYFVPEPSTYALAAIASGVMAVLARRRKQLQIQAS
jgi:DNA-binding beta-propeller fold protein YncE